MSVSRTQPLPLEMRLGSTLAEGNRPFAWLRFVVSWVKDSHLPIVAVPYGVIPSLHGTSLQCWLLEVTPVAQRCGFPLRSLGWVPTLPAVRGCYLLGCKLGALWGQGRKTAPSVFHKSFMACCSCTNSFRAPQVGLLET